MITRHSPRAHLLVLLCMLSFAAAILAATAYAGQDFYCNGCTLSSSGVPATSGSTNHIANGMQLAVAADWHHYQYNISTGVTSCQRSGTEWLWFVSRLLRYKHQLALPSAERHRPAGCHL